MNTFYKNLERVQRLSVAVHRHLEEPEQNESKSKSECKTLQQKLEAIIGDLNVPAGKQVGYLAAALARQFIEVEERASQRRQTDNDKVAERQSAERIIPNQPKHRRRDNNKNVSEELESLRAQNLMLQKQLRQSQQERMKLKSKQNLSSPDSAQRDKDLQQDFAKKCVTLKMELVYKNSEIEALWQEIANVKVKNHYLTEQLGEAKLALSLVSNRRVVAESSSDTIKSPSNSASNPSSSVTTLPSGNNTS